MRTRLSARGVGLAACLLAPLGDTGLAQEPDSARLATALDSAAAALRAGGRIPGLAILVARGPRTILVRGYGYANLDHNVPADPQTVYAIGSITKQFVAAAVLRLVEEGKLRLDDALATYVPEFPTHGQHVTLRDLLRHTSGIRGGGALPGRNADRADYSREELLRTLASVYKDRSPVFSPGAAWAYASINYTLLGLVVEKVSGRALWDYLREQFFVPLGLTATAPCDPAIVVKHRATGYVSGEAGRGSLRVAPFMSPTLAVGGYGLCTSALDLLTWQRALVERKAVGAASYARMTEPEVLSDGTRPDYGYGIAVWQLGSEPMLFHTGGVPGFTAFLAYLPTRDLTVVVLINANADILAIGPTIARIARGLPQPADLAAAPQELARYVGTYASGGIAVDVRERDGHLIAEVKGSNSIRFLFNPRLLKQREAEFAVNWEPESRLTFLLSGERAEGVVLRYGGKTIRLRRTN